MRRRRWDEMSRRERTGVVVAGAIQIALAIAAWSDLARRRPDEVNGRKSTWAATIAINFVGPLLYFARGRRTA